eukprot:TRINITY_DN14_c0_g1_i1.p1 TRINITY_DN14_c0_g1~~TRINITY_DN14_c0_g1_i1.p1  ORF type:complete len:169 (+),score=23.30 TRINITY_DN14_c0_g1_i1:65-571(+)
MNNIKSLLVVLLLIMCINAQLFDSPDSPSITTDDSVSSTTLYTSVIDFSSFTLDFIYGGISSFVTLTDYILNSDISIFSFVFSFSLPASSDTFIKGFSDTYIYRTNTDAGADDDFDGVTLIYNFSTFDDDYLNGYEYSAGNKIQQNSYINYIVFSVNICVLILLNYYI